MEKQRISLVLGSGGARGLAHIGVIRCLEDRGFDVRYIAGSSIGALIGGIFAAGKLDIYADWVCALQKRDVLRLLDWSFRGAVFSGDRVINALRELIGERDIEDLPIGFTAVATELNEKREIWLNEGPLLDAVRASMAVPMVFAPVQRGHLLLVDGGIINPVPIAPTLNDPLAWTVAVDLNGHAEPLEPAPERDEVEAEPLERLQAAISKWVDNLTPKTSRMDPESPGTFEMMLRAMDTMQTTIARMKLAAYSPKLIIQIPRNLCTFFEFDRAHELIEFGYHRADETLAREGY